MPEDEPILRVQGLSKTYRSGLFGRKRHLALRDIDLDVGAGSVFGLLGPNGAGKTTLIKCLLGLVRIQEGKASLFGRAAGDAATRRRVGYLPEAHRLPAYLTGRQVLRMFAMLSGRSRAWAEERIDAWLERVGMGEAGDRKIREYSKGMQQRIGLAAAFVHEPDLVFLDEPTDGVDPVGRRDIRAMIAAQRDSGVTIFLNSHLLSEVQAMADRVVILDRGRIVVEGGVEELIARDGWHLKLSHTPADWMQPLGELAHGLQPAEGAHSFAFDGDEAQLDRLVDALRAQGIGLRELGPRTASLEESFLELLGEEGEQ